MFKHNPYPKPPDNIGKKGCMTFPDGKKYKFEVLDEVKHISKAYPDFCLYIQKIKFYDSALGEELRFCYYKIGVKPRFRGKWVWGQSCPACAVEDFNAIINKAQAAGLL